VKDKRVTATTAMIVNFVFITLLLGLMDYSLTAIIGDPCSALGFTSSLLHEEKVPTEIVSKMIT
jgi:hypothetical protein